jgi:hypothetical protein
MLSKYSVFIHSGMFNLLLWIVGIGFVTLLSAKDISNQDSNTVALKSAIQSFLPGKGIPQAARRDTSTIQKIVLIDEKGNIDTNKLVTIDGWRAKTVFDLVLVGVLKKDTVPSDTRNYSSRDLMLMLMMP